MHNAVRPASHVGVVSDKDDSLATLTQLAEGLEHHLARSLVKIARRLVRQNDGRVVDQRTSDGHALHLTTGKLVGAVVVVLRRQAHGRQRTNSPLGPLVHWRVGIRQRQHHVAQHRGTRQQVEALEHEPEPRRPQLGQLIVVQRGDVHTLEAIRPRGRRVQTAQQVHEGRLARTRRPHDAEELTPLDLQRYAFERMGVARSGLIDPMHVLHVDDRDGRHSPALRHREQLCTRRVSRLGLAREEAHR